MELEKGEQKIDAGNKRFWVSGIPGGERLRPAVNGGRHRIGSHGKGRVGSETGVARSRVDVSEGGLRTLL